MRVGIGVAVALAAVALAGTAVGQDDPIAARQKLMKMNNASARTSFQMVSGKAPYDAAVAAAAMDEIAGDMQKFVMLFPEGSVGPGSQASPDIWTHFDDFKALAAKLESDAKAASAAAANGVDAFKVAFLTANSDCMACHQKYRTQD